MKKIFSSTLMISAVMILTLAWADMGFAATDRVPVSGTPLLREQKRLLLRDYGPPSRALAERAGTFAIRADAVGQTQSFWAYDFGTGEFYQTTATCKDVTALSSGAFLFIYVENTQLTNDPNRYSSTALANIRNQYVNTILPT